MLLILRTRLLWQFEPKMPIQLSELRSRTDLDLPSGSYLNRSERKKVQTQRLLKWLIKIHGISDLDHSWPSKTHQHHGRV